MAHALGHETVSLNANLNDVASLESEIASIQPTAIAHFAGISFVPSKDEEAFYRVHALGTSNILNAALKLKEKPHKILLASSATVYGNSPAPFSVETQELQPIDHYAISKVAMEEMAKTFMGRLPIIIARPFNYTGVGQKGNFLIPKLVRHFAEKSESIELGNLNVEREFNDVLMICAAYLSLLDFGVAGETYNASSGKAHSLQEVLDNLSQITNHYPKISINPDFVRSNEVHRMCGNPGKLNQLLAQHKVSLPNASLAITLKEMLIASTSAQ
jgi:nucleoside-diphosphate-sugar epimerase